MLALLSASQSIARAQHQGADLQHPRLGVRQRLHPAGRVADVLLGDLARSTGPDSSVTALVSRAVVKCLEVAGTSSSVRTAAVAIAFRRLRPGQPEAGRDHAVVGASTPSR